MSALRSREYCEWLNTNMRVHSRQFDSALTLTATSKRRLGTDVIERQSGPLSWHHRNTTLPSVSCVLCAPRYLPARHTSKTRSISNPLNRVLSRCPRVVRDPFDAYTHPTCHSCIRIKQPTCTAWNSAHTFSGSGYAQKTLISNCQWPTY